MNHPSPHGPKRIAFVLLVCAGLFYTSFGTSVFAEPNSSKQELIERIESVEAEIESERSELKQINQKIATQTQSIEEKQKSVADEIVSVKRNIHRLKQEQQELNTTQSNLSDEVNSLEQTVERARNLYPVLRSMIERWTESVPPSRKRPDHKSALREANELMASENQPIQAVKKGIDVLIALLNEGRQVQILNTALRTPDGKRREVQLIRAGRAFIAYRTTNREQFGIRVNGENGFRWQTDLSSSVKERILQTIKQFKSAPDNSQSFAGFVLPLDPTQEMTADISGSTKTFVERLYSGGPVMIPLGLIALIAFVLILERFWTLSREQTDVNTLLQDVQTALEQDDVEGAVAACNDRSGAVASVLETLINARSEAAETMQDRVEEAILQQMPRLERFLPSLNVLAGVAPLLGLLGTVTGIIETFDVIAVFGSGNQQLMAGGISEALMTTATGLVIAIPILLCHGYFRSRVDTIIGNMERTAATIYNFLQSDPADGINEPEQQFSSN